MERGNEKMLRHGLALVSIAFAAYGLAAGCGGSNGSAPPGGNDGGQQGATDATLDSPPFVRCSGTQRFDIPSMPP